MILKQSIFDSNCDLLVNPVNCVGIMGAGLAKQFKLKYPKYYEEYKQLCINKQLQLGKVVIHNSYGIVSFPTKKHWRDKSYLSSIKDGLINLRQQVTHNSIAFPLLGCGLGGLNVDIVIPLIEYYFPLCDIYTV